VSREDEGRDEEVNELKAKKKLAKLQKHADGVEISSFEVFAAALEEVHIDPVIR